MLLTDEKIEVSTAMMSQAGLTKGAFTFGVPVDPKDPAKGVTWKELSKMKAEDFDAIEEYFLNKQAR